MAEVRGIPSTIFEQTDAGAEPMALDRVLLAGPFAVPAGRTAEDLAALHVVPVTSTRDICSAFGVRIEGTILDEEDRDVAVSFPAEDESSYTLDGLVRGDATLHRLYVKSRIADWLAARGTNALTDDEIVELRRLASFLAASLEEDPS